MLRRELYIGRFVWNRSRFVKKPGTNHRIRRARPQSEWKSLEKPELRIVSDDLWCAVRQRFAKVKATYPGHGNGVDTSRDRRQVHIYSVDFCGAECAAVISSSLPASTGIAICNIIRICLLLSGRNLETVSS
jgi:site-specific DNA recombinase